MSIIYIIYIPIPSNPEAPVSAGDIKELDETAAAVKSKAAPPATTGKFTEKSNQNQKYIVYIHVEGQKLVVVLDGLDRTDDVFHNIISLNSEREIKTLDWKMFHCFYF